MINVLATVQRGIYSLEAFLGSLLDVTVDTTTDLVLFPSIWRRVFESQQN